MNQPFGGKPPIGGLIAVTQKKAAELLSVGATSDDCAAVCN